LCRHGAVRQAAAVTSAQFRMKTTPLPSLREYHCRILPARYRRTVAWTSSSITLAIGSLTTPGFTVSITGTSVVFDAGAGDCAASGKATDSGGNGYELWDDDGGSAAGFFLYRQEGLVGVVE